MRILWLSHFVPYPPKGGSLQRTYHLLRQAAAKHEVHLVALNQRALLRTSVAVEEARSHLGAFVASAHIFELPADRTALHYGSAVVQALLGRAPFDVVWLRNAAVRQLLAAEPDRRFDLVHLDTLGLWPYVAQVEAAPRVLNHHNIESQMMARRAAREGHPIKRMIYRREAAKLARMEQSVCPEAAENLVVSALDGERLSGVAGPVPIVVVPNGVDVDYFAPRSEVPPSAGSLLFVGGMNWYPNRDAVVYLLEEIWPELAREAPDRTLTIVGQDPLPALRAAARDPRVRAPGFVDDVRPYFDEAEIYVCPLRDGGGTRLKVLDALAMAKPLVATALAVEGLELEDGTHYVRAETPREFVDRIRLLERDPALRRGLATAGRRLVVERFAWPVIGRALDQAYRRAGNGRADHAG